MQKEAPLFMFRKESNGTAAPFFARLLLSVLQLRDKLLNSSEDKLYFDNQYARFFEPAKLAYLSYRKLITLHNEYVGELSSGAITFVQQAILIEKTIDSDARSLTNTILSEADIAFKGYVNEFLNMFDGAKFGFLAQKDHTYQVGIAKLRPDDYQLAEYLDQNRKAWMSQMNTARNRKEHAGWQLPKYQFGYNEKSGRVEMLPPRIDGMLYLDFLALVLSGLFTFVEELTIHLLSVNLKFETVYQIPLKERNKANMARFATCFVTDTYYEPWALQYTGPDYSLIE